MVHVIHHTEELPEMSGRTAPVEFYTAPYTAPIDEPRSLYRLRDKLRQHPPDAKVELSTATLLMLVEELIEARKAR